jgi:hypothetical protein
LRSLAALPGFRVATVSVGGLVEQVQASLGLAATLGTPFILYVEPDKELFFANHLHEFLRRGADDADVGVILAGRSDESFQTFPETQRCTEGAVNRMCGQLLGCGGDFTYGPFLMAREVLPDVTRLPPHLGWGWRLATFAAARRRGLRLLHIVDDYICPTGQQTEDEAERHHRVRQFRQNVLGLLHSEFP